MLFICGRFQNNSRMLFLEKLILGFAGADIIDQAERRHNEHVQEREQRRQDSLFWQEAARRGSAAYEDDDDEDF